MQHVLDIRRNFYLKHMRNKNIDAALKPVTYTRPSHLLSNVNRRLTDSWSASSGNKSWNFQRYKSYLGRCPVDVVVSIKITIPNKNNFPTHEMGGTLKDHICNSIFPYVMQT